MKKHYTIKAAAVTNMGLSRDNNEDNILIGNYYLDENDLLSTKAHNVTKQFSCEDNYAIFAVSDGMGGESLGEVASSTVVSTLQNEVKNQKFDLEKAETTDKLKSIILKINENVLKSAFNFGVIQIGATLAMLMISGNFAQSVNVGDSRVYFIRNGKLLQISKDQTEAQLLLDAGLINKKKLANHPSRCRLLQYMGYKEIDNNKLNPSFSKVIKIKENDRFLICSDGLTDMLTDKEIRKLLKANDDEKAAAEALVTEALKKGGKDNVTVTVVNILSHKR